MLEMSREEFIRSSARENMVEYGIETEAEALALAELDYEDLKRKGCTCETTVCPLCSKMGNCPLLDWEKRHPEFVNDELAQKIRSRKVCQR